MADGDVRRIGGAGGRHALDGEPLAARPGADGQEAGVAGLTGPQALGPRRDERRRRRGGRPHLTGPGDPLEAPLPELADLVAAGGEPSTLRLDLLALGGPSAPEAIALGRRRRRTQLEPDARLRWWCGGRGLGGGEAVVDAEVGGSGRVGDDEQLAVTHTDQVTGLQGQGRCQGLAVDRGAVGGPEVLGDRRAGHRRDAEVLAGHRRVGDDPVTERRAPTEGQLAVEDHGGPEQGPGHAHQAADGCVRRPRRGGPRPAGRRRRPRRVPACRCARRPDRHPRRRRPAAARTRQGVELAAPMDDQVTCGSTDRDRHRDLASTPHRPQATAREDTAALRVAPAITTRSVSRP